MPISSRFYEVLKPFRIYRQKGVSLSNTFIGSSQVYDNVYDVLNAKPADVIHDLPGGVFIGMAGAAGRIISLKAPKHIFERSYGFVSDSKILEGLLKAGKVKEIPAPEDNPDYRAWGEASRVDLGKLRRQLDVVEASPELKAFCVDVLPAISDWAGDAAVVDFDHGENPVVGAVVSFPDGKVYVEWCFIPDFYRVRSGAAEPAVLAGMTIEDRLTRDQLLELISAAPAPLP